ncbi:MAG: diguanylate cyclase [Gammaproteobacteria bacterium]|nr:diguanylate cyclase [Gammaproteobacteria bacterium]
MLQHLDTSLVQRFLDNLPNPLALLDNTGQLVWCNSGFAQLCGATPAQLVGKQHEQLPADVQRLLREELVVTPTAADNPVAHVSCIAAGLGANTIYYCNDVTSLHLLAVERDTLLHRLTEMQPTDVITGLFNRRSLLAHLEQETARSRRYGNPMSIMLLRLANIDEYRSHCGVAATDGLMLAIGQSLKDQMRWADVIGRYAENEFMLIMPETTEQAAVDLCGKILEQIGKIPRPNAKQALQIDFGMAQWRRGEDVGLLMQRARQHLDANPAQKIAV